MGTRKKSCALPANAHSIARPVHREKKSPKYRKCHHPHGWSRIRCVTQKRRCESAWTTRTSRKQALMRVELHYAKSRSVCLEPHTHNTVCYRRLRRPSIRLVPNALAKRGHSSTCRYGKHFVS